MAKDVLSASTEGNTSHRRTNDNPNGWLGLAVKSIIVLQGIVWTGVHISDYLSPSTSQLESVYGPATGSCRPPLPQLGGAVSPTDSIFRKPSDSLDRFLRSAVTRPDIDSLAVAVVTSSGAIFQRGYGVLKANETDTERMEKVDKDSIYRIASITKMFNTLETLILRDRGVLDWDDPVTKYFPNFTYNTLSWPEYLSRRNHTLLKGPRAPLTIRQLASHMSGLGRDYYPLSDVGKWPASLPLDTHTDMVTSKKSHLFTPGVDDLPTRHDILREMRHYPLILPPYSYPIYSNLGFDLLGWVNVEANAASGNRLQEPDNFADLLHRDIFEHVGMNSSFFTVPPKAKKRVAVAKTNNEETFLDFTDAYNPAGGQYSSLSDMSVFMQTLLDPHRKNSVLSPYTVREWLRPLYGWSDDFTEVGAPWEIQKYPDSFGRQQRFYQKGGNLESHHSMFAVNPSSSYGIIVLVAGQFSNTGRFANEAIQRFQPVLDHLQQHAASTAYAGRWSSGGEETNTAVTATRGGSLWIDELFVNGTDVLALLQERKPGKSKPFALWSTGPERTGEFRIAIGRPALNDDPLFGCEPYWVSIDSFNSGGIPIDLLYFDQTGNDGKQVLKIPSVGVSMNRTPPNHPAYH